MIKPGIAPKKLILREDIKEGSPSHIDTMSTPPKIVKKIRRKKIVDNVDFVALGKSEEYQNSQNEDIGELDFIINKHNNNKKFKNRTFIETIDADKLYNALLNMKGDLGRLEFKDELGHTKKLQITSDDEKKALKTYRQFYMKFFYELAITKDKDGKFIYELHTTYKSKDDTPFGRIYPKGNMSITQILRALRHYIAREDWIDLDFVCSAPRTNCGIFKDCGLCVDMLYVYIKNREKILNEVIRVFNITRDEAKGIFNRECCGGHFRHYLDEIVKCPIDENTNIYKYLTEFHNEMEKNIDYVFGCEKYKEIREEVCKNFNSKKRMRRSFACKLYHIVEIELLKIVFDTLLELDIIEAVNTRCALSHDGIMITKKSIAESKYTIEEVLEKINYNLVEKSGLKCIKMIAKGMDEHKEIEDAVRKGNWITYVDRFYEKYATTRYQLRKVEYTDETQIKDYFLTHQEGMYMTTAIKDDKKITPGSLYRRSNDSGLWCIINDNQFKNELLPYMKMMYDYLERLRENKWRFTENVKRRHLEGLNMLEGWWRKMNADNPELLKDSPFSNCEKELENILGVVAKNRNDSYLKLINILRTEIGRNKICNAVKTATCNNDFYDLLDTNPFLLGFNNGVYDLRTQQFRKCGADEYVGMSCGYDFYTPDNCREEDKEEIGEFIKEIEEDLMNLFLEKSEYEWTMMMLSRSLLGAEESNKEEKIVVLIGDGGNGKGFIDKAVRGALGEYAVLVLPENMRDGLKENSSGIYAMFKKRFGSVSEPDGSWNNTILKTLVSDAISVRTNFQTKQTEFKPPPILVSCNPPGIQLQNAELGDALTRRFIQIKMMKSVKSDEEYDPTNPLHLKRKNGYEWTDNRKRAMMCILMRYFEMYRANGSNIENNIPMRFKQNTREFLSNMNPEDMWINEQITIVEQNPRKHLLAYDTTVDGFHYKGFMSYIMKHAPKVIKDRLGTNKEKVKKCVIRATGLSVESSNRCYDIDGKLVSDRNDKIHKARCFHNVIFGKLADEEEEEEI